MTLSGVHTQAFYLLFDTKRVNIKKQPERAAFFSYSYLLYPLHLIPIPKNTSPYHTIFPNHSIPA